MKVTGIMLKISNKGISVSICTLACARTHIYSVSLSHLLYHTLTISLFPSLPPSPSPSPSPSPLSKLQNIHITQGFWFFSQDALACALSLLSFPPSAPPSLIGEERTQGVQREGECVESTKRGRVRGEY